VVAVVLAFQEEMLEHHMAQQLQMLLQVLPMPVVLVDLKQLERLDLVVMVVT
jgi:hypothetical protein